MHSTQDSLAHANGVFGGIRISDAIGNTGADGSAVIEGPFGLIDVLAPSTFSAFTTGNIQNFTGYMLSGDMYGGRFTSLELSGGDVIAYRFPTE